MVALQCAEGGAWPHLGPAQRLLLPLRQVRIYDRNCVAYNISTPQGLYTFATFLLWLRLYHAEDLRSKMDSARLETFLQRLESDDPRVLWTRAQQHI